MKSILKIIWPYILIAAIGGIWWQSTKSVKRQINDLKVELAKASKYAPLHRDTIRDSLTVVTQKVSEVEKIKEVITPQEKELIEDLNLKVKQLTQLQQTALQTRDTVYLSAANSSNHPPDTTLRYSDRWCDFTYKPSTQSLAYSIRDSLTTIVSRQYKHRFLFWKWGTKGYDVRIVNHNPHSTVTYNSFISSDKK